MKEYTAGDLVVGSDGITYRAVKLDEPVIMSTPNQRMPTPGKRRKHKAKRIGK